MENINSEWTKIQMNGMTAFRFSGHHWCIVYGSYGKFIPGCEDITDFTEVINILTEGAKRK